MQGGSSGDATSLLKGGGEDLTRQAGQVAKSDGGDRKSKTPPKYADLDPEKAEQMRFQEAKQRIEALIEANPDLRQFRDQLCWTSPAKA